MVLDQRKYEGKHTDVLRDLRPAYVRFGTWLQKPAHSFSVYLMGAGSLFFMEKAVLYTDIIVICYLLMFWWLATRDRALCFKLPMSSKWKDKNNEGPGRSGNAEGILYVGNNKDTDEQLWFTNSDVRTHILYLGTTGSGKTEGLKSMATNAMCWSSGFVYVDGKADTDLWSSLSSLARRFGRDDDLLILNYMTGNSDARAPSNTMNPFSSGSASYLTQMLVSLMPDAEGDNAMWKERAVSLISSLMPALTYKRDYQEIPMSIGLIREYLTLNNIIKLSRDDSLPPDIAASIQSYLDTLPGYIAAAYDDEGKEIPPGPNQPQYDTTTPNQQHGFLSMQFTRALQSLGDDYGYIFDTQAADVDMLDVVLNRRMLVVLIPALEKSGDETANLGKIVAATLKGMMGSTLGATVEGESATVIENKPTHAPTPFMTIFDEVGYYTAEGMAVMAAQARSLGFCLIYAAQDLAAMKKRVKEEANSITANCNLKLFGKLEDPTDTKDFFEKTVGEAIVYEASGFQLSGGSGSGSYHDTKQASMQIRARASYDGLKSFKEGQAIVCFGDQVVEGAIFYSNPGHAKAMRVARYLPLPAPDDKIIKHSGTITDVRDKLVHKTWTAMKADVAEDTPAEIEALMNGYKEGQRAGLDNIQAGMMSVVSVYALNNEIAVDEKAASGSVTTPAATVAPEVASPTTEATEAPAKAPAARQSAAEKAAAAKAATPPATPPATATPATPETPPAQADGNASGNPMSMFSKKPAGDTSETAATGTPPATPPPAQAEGSASDNPMSTFSKKPAGSTPETAAATPPATPDATAPQPAAEETEKKAAEPINWQDLVKQSTETEPPAAEAPATTPTDTTAQQATPPAAATTPQEQAQTPPSAAPETVPPLDVNIDEETDSILRKAGSDAGSTLFKGKYGDDDVEAAE